MPIASDAFVYTKGSGHDYIMFILFVDDFLATGPTEAALKDTCDKLETKFSITDLGDVSLTLGMEILRHKKAGTLEVQQHKCVLSVGSAHHE